MTAGGVAESEGTGSLPMGETIPAPPVVTPDLFRGPVLPPPAPDRDPGTAIPGKPGESGA